MSFFRFLLPLIALFSVFLYFALLNPGEIDFLWARGRALHLPLIALLMAAFFLGTLLSVLTAFAKGVGGFFQSIESGFRRAELRRIERTFLKARRSAEQGMMAHALAMLEGVLDRHPRHYEALMLKGDILRQMGRPAEALGAHSLALSLRPAMREAVLRINEDYAAAGDWDAAHRLLEQARERWPGDAAVVAALRDANVARGDFRRAMLAQKELLAGAGEDELPAGQVRMAELYLLYGEQLMTEGKADMAKERFAAAAHLEPRFLAAKMLLADALLALHLRGEAEGLLMKEFRETHDCVPLLRLDALAQAGGAAKSLDLMKWAADIAPEEKLLPLLVLLREMDCGLHSSARNHFATLDPAVVELPLGRMVKALLELHASAGADPLAMAAMEEALAAERRAFVKYRCQACAAAQDRYFAQCPECGAWSSAAFFVEGHTPA